MQQALDNVQQLRQEANIPRKKSLKWPRIWLNFVRAAKIMTVFVTGFIENNPYQEEILFINL
ncbi:hypothetical protein Mgra_00009886, partial [Meloidogyne graminicola]